MGNIRLYGSTSGYTELAPPAVAPDGVLSLPSGVGTLLTAEGGKVLQVVRATDTTERVTTSTSFTDASISVTITPQKSTSVILLIWAFYPVTSSVYPEFQITDNSNNALSGAEAASIGDGGGFQTALTLIAYATPATTSATTYKARFRAPSGQTVVIRNQLQTGQMYAIEVSA